MVIPRLGKRYVVWLFVALCVVAVLYILQQGKVTLSPFAERDRMEQLEDMKKRVAITEFVSDGCSGNVSTIWSGVVGQLSKMFPDINERYFDAQSIPFEYACEAHDRLYHEGVGGYVGRLQADNQLREDILIYAIDNIEEIKQRTGLQSDEAALFLYETIADLVYRGVRLGGAPCSGESYAWGYGYGGGVCE